MTRDERTVFQARAAFPHLGTNEAALIARVQQLEDKAADRIAAHTREIGQIMGAIEAQSVLFMEVAERQAKKPGLILPSVAGGG